MYASKGAIPEDTPDLTCQQDTGYMAIKALCFVCRFVGSAYELGMM